MRKLVIIWLVLFLPLLLFGGGMQAYDDKAQVYRGPIFDSTDTYNLHVDSVIVTKDTTYVHCTYCGLRASWASISDSTYLEDIVTHDRFYILKSLGLPYSPNKREYNDGEIFNVVLLFPSINETKKFNLIENKKQKWFNIYNIDLDCCTDTVLGVKDLAQLLPQKDSLILAKDTMNLVRTMDQIYKVSSSLYGVKSDNYVNCVIDGMSIYKEFKLWDNAISHIDMMHSLLLEDKSVMSVTDYLQTEYFLLQLKAGCYIKLNRIEEGISLYHQCISIFNEIDSIDRNYEDYKKILTNLVDCYSELNDKDKAIKYNKERIKICENHGKYNNYSLYLESVLDYYSALGQYKEAVAFSELELANLSDTVDIESRALLLFSLCENSYRLYNTGKAIKYGEQGLLLFKELTDIKSKTFYLYASLYLGLIYMAHTPELNKSEYYLKEAIDVYLSYSTLLEGIIDKYSIYHTYHCLSLLYKAKQKYDLALEMEIKSGEMCKAYLKEEDYAEHLRAMGDIFFEQYEYSKAIGLYQKSLEICKETNLSDICKVSAMLVKSYMNIKDTINAKKIANKCIHYYKTEGNIFNDDDAWCIANILFLINDYHNAAKCLSNLLDHTISEIIDNIGFISEKQIQNSLSRLRSYINVFIQIVLNVEKNNEYTSKLCNYALFFKNLQFYSNFSDGNSLLMSDLKTKWKDIKDNMSQNEIAIEFIESNPAIGDMECHALLIDKSHDYPQMITLFKINKDLRNLADSIGWYDLVWSPIFDKWVGDNTIDTIYFSPTSITNYMNIEHALIDYDIPVYRLSSLNQITKRSVNRHIRDAVLYGGLDYNKIEISYQTHKEMKENSFYRGMSDRSGFDPLNESFEEVKAIDYLLTHKGKSSFLYEGGEGTEESFKILSGKKKDLIHLATHGMYIPPKEIYEKKKANKWDFLAIIDNEDSPFIEDYSLTHSFLVMSGGNQLMQSDSIPEGMDDGIVTAQEIARLDLRGLDLVVLSACQSALGDFNKNGNIMGLQRGFKKAGANTIIMSLSKVDDEATKLFMIEFYKNLLYGETKFQSFRNAQEYLRKVGDGKFDKPEYWASFIMLDGLN